MKRGLGVVFGIALFISPFMGWAQFVPSSVPYTNSKYGISVLVPSGWVRIENIHTSLRGEEGLSLYVTQQGDLTSRYAKGIYIEAGSPSVVFGVSPKVVQRVSNEQLVDFYIDQFSHSSANFTVIKTYTKGEGASKQYVIESKHTEPGQAQFITTDYFQFKNAKVYHWQIQYMTTHSTYASTLQTIADSITLQ